MAKNYTNETLGMTEFYDLMKIKSDIDYSVNSDGIYYGILFEHKINIDDLGKVLMQMIKYASKLRILGKRIPEKFIAIDLNKEHAYVFNSINYLDKIEKIYLGASSKNNTGLSISTSDYKTIDYSNSDGDFELRTIIKSAKDNPNYTKYHVDFTNILSLSKEFYKHKNDKDAFINGPDCEIRKPTVLSDRIFPYDKDNNNEFSNIMDCLNTNVQQAALGAFYTPDPYVKKSQEMLLNRIEKLKEMGLDYIVIDRCAGTGNLYKGLPDEVLEHCVLSTLEANEYLVLQEEFVEKATIVVPPTDALAYDIIPTEVDGNGNIVSDFIREKINDKLCAVILYENPPYSEAAGLGIKGLANSVSWKNTFVANEISKELRGDVKKELSNLFIWSAFKYYLTKPFDSYIVYSPIKYWKQMNLVNKEIEDSFLCNRKHFHASESSIFCMHFLNKTSDIDNFKTKIYDIDEDNIFYIGDIMINKVNNALSKLYDKRVFDNDEETKVISEANGLEFNYNGRKNEVKALFNINILAYMSIKGFIPDAKNIHFTRTPHFHGRGTYLRNDNYINLLPPFCAALSYEIFKWFEKNSVCMTNDGNGSYVNDKDFLKKCFIYSCLTFRNKCRSLNGSDGRYYRNELCFDEGTLASKDLANYTLTNEEQDLINSYNDLLKEIKNCEEYNPDFSYGTFQIQEEINIDVEVDSINKKGEPVKVKNKKYNNVNTLIVNLKKKLKDYYKNNIYQDLYKYELLK